MGMVGYNDETKEIAYLWFYDFDYDYISDAGENKEDAMKALVEDNLKL